MIEAFYFYDIDKGMDSEPEISFLDECHEWPVPAEGQILQIRKAVGREDIDQFMEGQVRRVVLYYSLQNRGPVVKVFLKKAAQEDVDYSKYRVRLIEELNLQEKSADEKELLDEFRQMAIAGHKNHANVGARELLKEFSTCRMTFCQRRFNMCRYEETEVLQ